MAEERTEERPRARDDERPLRDLADWYSIGYGPSRQDLGNYMPDPWRILEALSAQSRAQGGPGGGGPSSARMSGSDQLLLTAARHLPDLFRFGMNALTPVTVANDIVGLPLSFL